MSAAKKILIVEDDSALVDYLTTILDADGYRVDSVANGAAALAKFKTETLPDLVLLDVVMPIMDGFEVCRKMRQDEKTRTLPVMFITSKGEVADEVRGMGLGAVDYIIKPITDPERILARIAAHITNHAVVQESESSKSTKKYWWLLFFVLAFIAMVVMYVL